MKLSLASLKRELDAALERIDRLEAQLERVDAPGSVATRDIYDPDRP